MSIMFIGDPHVTPNTQFSKPTDTGLTTHLHDISAAFEMASDLITERKPEAVVCVGDVFETQGYVDSMSLTVATQCFADLATTASAVGATVYVMLGNHDMLSRSRVVHSLSFLDEFENVEVVQMPQSVPTKIGNLYLLPYFDDAATIQNYLNEAREIENPILVSHMDIIDMTYAGSRVAIHGVSPSELADFSLVINGHHHVPSRRDNIWNIGSLMARTFNDAEGEFPRGFVFVDEALNVDVVPNPHTKMFKVVEVNTEDDVAELGAMPDLDRTHLRIDYNPDCKEAADVLASATAASKLHPIYVQPEGTRVEGVDLEFDPKDNVTAYINETFKETFSEEERKFLIETACGYLDGVSHSSMTTVHDLKITSLELENFMSFGEATLTVPPSGVWLVEGVNRDSAAASSNGSGKSSLFEGLYYALTGKTLRKLTGDDVIHEGAEYCGVRLKMTVDGSPYTIERYRKHPEHKTTIRFLAGDADLKIHEAEDIAARKMDDTQSLIEATLGLRDNVLDYVVFLTDGLATRFTSLSDPAKKAFIETLVDVEIYSNAQTMAKNDHKDRQAEASRIEGALQANESGKARTVQQLDTAAAAYQEVFGNSEGRRIQFEFERDDAKRDAEEAGKELEIVRSNMETLNAAIETARAGQSEFRATQDQTRQLISENDAARGELRRQIQTHESAIAGFEKDIQHLQSGMDKTQKLIDGGNCPTCEQPVDAQNYAQHFEETVAKQEGFRGQIGEERAKIEAVQAQIAEKDTMAERYATKLEGLAQHLSKSDAAIQSQTVSLSQFQQKEREYNDRILKSTQSAELKQREIDGLDAEVAKRKEAVSALEQSLAGFDTERDALITESEANAKEMAYFDALSAVFSPTGIRSVVLDKVIGYLNERLSEYSKTILSDNLVQLSGTTATKKGKGSSNKISVISDRKYEKCSSGERRRLDFAIQMALNDLAVATSGIQINLLVCDEIVDTLDDVGKEAVHTVLADKAQDMVVYLVTHDAYLRGIVSNTIQVTKENSYSTLSE